MREREKEKKQEGRRRGAKIGEGTGGDASGHEVSLVSTATDKKRARPLL